KSQRTSDHEELNLCGALADLEDLRVTVVPGDRELVHEPVTAEDLRRIASVVHCGVAGDEFGDRGFFTERLARIAQSCRVVPGKACGVHACAHSGQRELCILARAESSAEDRSALRIVDGCFQASLRCP